MPQTENPQISMNTGSFYCRLPLNGHANANYCKIGDFVKKMTSFALLIS